jgi:hypothetical protein
MVVSDDAMIMMKRRRRRRKRKKKKEKRKKSGAGVFIIIQYGGGITRPMRNEMGVEVIGVGTNLIYRRSISSVPCLFFYSIVVLGGRLFLWVLRFQTLACQQRN